MELRQLEYFVAVAGELNFSRASLRIHVVQSALSASVARLEKELGVELFDRSKRQIVLTPAGEVFLQHAREVIHTAQRAQSSVADYRDQLTGTVTLGTLMSWGGLNLAAVLEEFRRLHPLVTVQLRQSLTGSSGHLDAIADGKMDLALVSLASSSSRLVAVRELVHEPMVFVCESSHVLAGRRHVHSPSSPGRTSFSSREGGESASASMRVSPLPGCGRRAPTKSPTTRSPPSSCGTGWRRRCCPSTRPTDSPIYASFR